MTENNAVFTLTAALDVKGQLTVKTDGICTNHLFGKILEEIGYLYDEAVISIDKNLVLDDNGKFQEEVEESATKENNKTIIVPVIVISFPEETSHNSNADGEDADATE